MRTSIAAVLAWSASLSWRRAAFDRRLADRSVASVRSRAISTSTRASPNSPSISARDSHPAEYASSAARRLSSASVLLFSASTLRPRILWFSASALASAISARFTSASAASLWATATGSRGMSADFLSFRGWASPALPPGRAGTMARDVSMMPSGLVGVRPWVLDLLLMASGFLLAVKIPIVLPSLPASGSLVLGLFCLCRAPDESEDRRGSS
mmetsp:Transcript_51858/g.126483  ORF Transcript_51858/g.126483 Transcript_51858/m.126483 type:complete len:213 (+) Transcript_51858:60-698(+)